MNQVLTHKWQEQGLGVAPFRAVGIISVPGQSLCEANPEAYNRQWAEVGEQARRLGVTLCTCYSCGQSLVNNVIIRDAQGKNFVVGLDCAGRTGDSKLIAEADLLEKRRQRTIREARAQAEREERRVAHEANLAAQRARNGGLTDYEAAQKASEEEAARQAQAAQKANGWVIEVLRQAYPGDFVRAMIANLERQPLTEALRGRARDIVGEIYAKTKGGRKGSKAYKAAEAEFCGHFEE